VVHPVVFASTFPISVFAAENGGTGSFVVIFVMSRGVLLVAFNEGMEIDLTYGSY
jgi:hypothetical protein